MKLDTRELRLVELALRTSLNVLENCLANPLPGDDAVQSAQRKHRDALVELLKRMEEN